MLRPTFNGPSRANEKKRQVLLRGNIKSLCIYVLTYLGINEQTIEHPTNQPTEPIYSHQRGINLLVQVIDRETGSCMSTHQSKSSLPRGRHIFTTDRETIILVINQQVCVSSLIRQAIPQSSLHHPVRRARLAFLRVLPPTSTITIHR